MYAITYLFCSRSQFAKTQIHSKSMLIYVIQHVIQFTLQIAACSVKTFTKEKTEEIASHFFLCRHNTTFSRLPLSFFWKWHNIADRTAASEFYFCLQISVLFSVRYTGARAISVRDFTSFFLLLSFHYFLFPQAHNTYFRRDDAIDLIKKSRRRVNVIGNRWSRLRELLEKLYASLSLSFPFSFSMWFYFSSFF